MPTRPNALREARQAAGLSISELARRAGMTRRTIYLIEAGNPARVETYCRLARALGIPPARLLRPVLDGVPA